MKLNDMLIVKGMKQAIADCLTNCLTPDEIEDLKANYHVLKARYQLYESLDEKVWKEVFLCNLISFRDSYLIGYPDENAEYLFTLPPYTDCIHALLNTITYSIERSLDYCDRELSKTTAKYVFISDYKKAIEELNKFYSTNYTAFEFRKEMFEEVLTRLMLRVFDETKS